MYIVLQPHVARQLLLDADDRFAQLRLRESRTASCTRPGGSDDARPPSVGSG